MFATIIVKDFNKSLNNSAHPETFKISEAITVYKRDEITEAIETNEKTKALIDGKVYYLIPKFQNL